MKIGIQLWTLHDLVKKDLPGTLSALNKIGYNSLETFDFDGSFYSLPVKEFHTICNDLGMEISSTHCSINESNAAFYADKAAEAGLEYIILPSFNGRPEKTISEFQQVALEMNRIGEITQKSGVKFGYHNHDFEFQALEGRLPYDILLSETDPELVIFEMDIYWLVKAGQDPLYYFDKYPCRFETWHMKDMGNDGESCIVGNGIIPFKKLMNHSRKAGLKRIFVEQEQFSEGTPLFCIEQSYRHIQKYLI